MKALASRQRGVSFSGLLVWVVLLIFVAIGAMKLIPAYVENAKINKIFSTIAQDPEMQTATAKAVRESYSKRAQIDDVKVIDPNDIDVVKDASGLSLSISYPVKVPLFGNASLLLDFHSSSSSR